MSVDPSSLSRAATSTIETDKPCHNCGYNLKGLSPGAPCPECGTHIPVKRVGIKGDNLADAPIRFLRRFAWAVLLNAILLPATILAIGLAAQSQAVTFVALAIALAFVGSTWLVTMQREKSERSINDNIIDNPKWRLTIRLGVIAWPVYAASFFLLNALTPGSTAHDAVAFAVDVLDLVATLALVPLLIHHSVFAAWAGDTGLESRFRGSCWILVAGSALMVIGSLIQLIAPRPIDSVVAVVSIFIAMAYFGAAIVAIIGVFQLAAVAFGAVSASRAATERDARIAARRAKEMARTVDRQFSAPEPVNPYESDLLETQHVPSDSNTKPIQGRLHRLEAADDLDAYELADDPPPPDRSAR